ncbi:MAG: DNA-protecting protein DprA [Chitinophagales bacterium]|nr:DNA-protecting protein DprA [Chitinophagales bacterium]
MDAEIEDRMQEYYKIGLAMVEGVGIQVTRKLVGTCGNPEAVFKEKSSNLSKIPGISSKVISQIHNKELHRKIEMELKFISANKISILFFTDDDFPFRLKQCIDCPVLLYNKGRTEYNSEKVISIVGTRKPSKYGIHFCEKLIGELANFEILIVSGLAYGIDGLVHRTCINYDIRTAGVLGHGLNIAYPHQHKSLYRSMAEKESLLSEFSSQHKFYKQNFVRRNRIVAGMCDAVVVIESGIKGGSLITASLANSYHRDVFALPGRYSDVKSAGCNALIKNNKAGMIESAYDLIHALMWKENEDIARYRQKELMLTLSEDETKIMDYLNTHDEVLIEKLANSSKIPLQKLSSLLLSLELRGLIAAIPGNKYKLI